MTRNLVTIAAVGFALLAIVLAHQLYRERQNAERVEIRVDDHGLSIERK